MHSRHLFFLRQGLLLADRSIAVVIRDILEICVRFTGLVERWGGDVVPELLLEGSDVEEVGQLVDERSRAVSVVNEASTIPRSLEFSDTPLSDTSRSDPYPVPSPIDHSKPYTQQRRRVDHKRGHLIFAHG